MYRPQQEQNEINLNNTFPVDICSPSHTKENAPPFSDRRSEASKQRINLQTRLETLNTDLRYSGFNELKVCLCDSASFDSLNEVIRDILAENSKLGRRIKQMQQEISDERTNRQLREREKQQLSNERDHLTREKDTLLQKLKGLARQQKEKEQKWLKEKDVFAKERRGWMQRQDASRNQTRNLEEKTRQLQQKLKRILQKGDKTEYRNAAFEVFTPINRGERSMLQREYEQGVANSIEQHTRNLEEENRMLREVMKEVFMRLQRVAQRIDPEQATDSHRPEIIDLPTQRGKGYPDLLRKFLAALEERTNQLRTSPLHSCNSKNSSSNDTAELMQTVNRLKGFYASWQAVNESRKAVVPQLLQIAAQRTKLAKLAELSEFEEAETEGRINGVEEVESYVAQKMEYFNREIKRVNRWNSQMESLSAEII